MQGRVKTITVVLLSKKKNGEMEISDLEKIIKKGTGFGLLEVPLRARHAAKNYCPFLFFSHAAPAASGI